MVFVERLSVELGESKMSSFVMAHLWVRLIVGNCTLQFANRIVAQARLDVHGLWPHGLGAGLPARVWGPKTGLVKSEQGRGVWLLVGRCQSRLVPAHTSHSQASART